MLPAALATALVLLMASSTYARAGQVRATFKVGLRVDPVLVERDLNGRGTTRTVARRKTALVKPMVLRRAGGSGLCHKAYVSKRRFRWRCD